MPLWNDSNLCAPNSDFCSYDFVNTHNLEVASNLVSILTRVANELGSGHPVWNEIKVFEALHARVALKLPCDKFFHLFQRICSCFRNLVIMKLPKLCLDLAESFLRGISLAKLSDAEAADSGWLPSCQQLEFLLIRIQGTAKLVSQTLKYTEKTFLHLLQGLSVGHMTHCLLMVSSAVARARFSYKAFLVQLCDFYKELKPFCSKLMQGTWQWPCDPELPEDMWEWLKPEEVLMQNNIVTSENLKFLNDIFKPKEMKEIEDKSDSSQNVCYTFSSLNTDVGEIQARGDEQNMKTDIVKIEEQNMKIDMEGPSQQLCVPEYYSSDVLNTDSQQCVSDLKQNPTVSSAEQENLFKIISRAKTVKTLSLITKNLHSDGGSFLNHLPKSLQESSVLAVRCAMKNLKSGIRKMKQEKSANKKALNACKKRMISAAKQDILVLLGFHTGDTSSQCSDVEIVDVVYKSKLKPVKTLPEFRRLFRQLKSTVLHTKKNAKLSKKLTSKFKSCLADVKTLKECNNNTLAKKLIFVSSKKLIKMCIKE